MRATFDSLALELKWRIYSTGLQHDDPGFANLKSLRLLSRLNAREFAPLLAQCVKPILIMFNEVGLAQLEAAANTTLTPHIRELSIADVFTIEKAMMFRSTGKDFTPSKDGILVQSRLALAHPYNHESWLWAAMVRFRIRNAGIGKESRSKAVNDELSKLWDIRCGTPTEIETYLRTGEVADAALLARMATLLERFKSVRALRCDAVKKAMAVCKNDHNVFGTHLPPVYANSSREFEASWHLPDCVTQPEVSAVNNLIRLSTSLTECAPAFGSQIQNLSLHLHETDEAVPTQSDVHGLLTTFPNLRILELGMKRSFPSQRTDGKGRTDGVILVSYAADFLSSTPLRHLHTFSTSETVDAADVLKIMTAHKYTLRNINAPLQQNYTTSVEVSIAQLEIMRSMPKGGELDIQFDVFHRGVRESTHCMEKEGRLMFNDRNLGQWLDWSVQMDLALAYFYAVRAQTEFEAVECLKKWRKSMEVARARMAECHRPKGDVIWSFRTFGVGGGEQDLAAESSLMVQERM
jgi:hypothetical protein